MNFFSKIFLFSILLISTFSLFAQNGIGVRAGITLPNNTVSGGSTSVSFDANMGLTLAGIFEIGISEQFAIQTELAFIQKGSKSDDEDFFTGEPFESKIRVNHIDVPVLAKVKFGTKKIAGFVLAGPSVGYAISGSITENGDKEKFEDENWENYNRLEIAGIVGGGIGLNLASGALAILDLRYSVSLTNLSEDNDDITFRNKGLAISVGVISPL